MFRYPLLVVALVVGGAPLLLAVSNPVVQEPIDGAFGLRLGAKFIPNDRLQGSTTINGRQAYYFSPLEQSRFFEFYLVQITPVSHRIHTITAVGQTDAMESCHHNRAALMSALTRRYGPAVKEGPVHANGFDMDHEVIMQADHKRGVAFMCGGTSPTVLQMIVLDDELSDLAEEERLEFVREANLRL